jgi:hypothetical protein
MWNMKCMIILVINGAIRMETKGLIKRNMEAIPGKHSADSLQQTATLGTSHIMQKVLQSNLKPEWWGTMLVQEKYREEKAVTRDINDNIIIIIIIIIIIDHIYLNNTVHHLQTSTVTGMSKSAGLHLIHKS